MKRRTFLTSSSALPVLLWFSREATATADAPIENRDRLRGTLLGGLIGDALGGPIEFRDLPASETGLAGARAWGDDERLTRARLQVLSESIPLLGYEEFRPETAPYGPWRSHAPAGTLTDDSRHKIVLVRALAAAKTEGRAASAEDIARQFLAFEPENENDSEQLRDLNEEGFREYRYAARWLLGERDESMARPLERLWAGVNNCSGQMMFPPLAVKYAGDPERAYRATYELDFIDTPYAKDMAAALVAGLASVLSSGQDQASVEGRWQCLLEAMQATDPFAYRDVPFAGRQLDQWMTRAREFAERAKGKPKQLYRLLETEGEPVFWWDAHFTMLVPLSMLHLCDFDPLAALHLTLDFGHDTDSYAQVLGCMIGAVHGASVFPERMVEAVESRLQSDFDENVDSWLEILG